MQARKSPEKENLSYKTTSVQALCKHDYQRHTWVLLGFFFFMSRKAIFYSDIYTYVSILPKRKNLKGSLHWMWKHT